MVQLEEVEDQEFTATQQGPKEDEDEWDTDDGMQLRDDSIKILANQSQPIRRSQTWTTTIPTTNRSSTESTR